MKLRRSLIVFAMSLFAMACNNDLFGLALGDLGGIWIASAYEYTSAQATVDLVARDGASMTISVENEVIPPTVATTFEDGMGLSTTVSGTVDIVVGTLTMGAETFSVEHSGERMTLTNVSGRFDFGSGTVPATLTIKLSRL